MEIHWRFRALRDLEHIHAYIAQDNAKAAARVKQTIRRSVEALSDAPQIGRAGRVEGTRELVVPGLPFIIAYRVKDGAVEILTILHAARRWPETM